MGRGHCTQQTVIRPISRLERLSYYPQLVQRVAELWSDGHALPEIARLLTHEGLRPAKGGETFTVSMVRRILARPDVQQLVERTRLTDGVPKGTQEWTTDELAELLGMPRVSLYVWLKKGILTARRTRYRHRSVWLIWADEAELVRLRALREHPHYGPPSKGVAESYDLTPDEHEGDAGKYEPPREQPPTPKTGRDNRCEKGVDKLAAEDYLE